MCCFSFLFAKVNRPKIEEKKDKNVEGGKQSSLHKTIERGLIIVEPEFPLSDIVPECSIEKEIVALGSMLVCLSALCFGPPIN